MDPCRWQRQGDSLLSLPQELLQLVLKEVPGKNALRMTCKAFSSAISNCCDTIVLRRSGLLRNGPRCEVAGALAAFPKARRVVFDFSGGRSFDPFSPCHDFEIPVNYVLPIRIHNTSLLASSDTRMAAADTDNASAATHLAPNEENLLAESLSGLSSTRRGSCSGNSITSLALLHLTCPPPVPSALVHLRSSLLELEISDASYSRAADQGAFNLLVRERWDICDRSERLVALAVSLPQLRRLSVASGAFSVGGVAALGGLTKLESLSLAGCVECPGAAAQAAETYRELLRNLLQLRQLRLPMAVASPSAVFLDEEDEENNVDRPYGNVDEHGGDGNGGGDGGSGLFFSGGSPRTSAFWRNSSSLQTSLARPGHSNVARDPPRCLPPPPRPQAPALFPADHNTTGAAAARVAAAEAAESAPAAGAKLPAAEPRIAAAPKCRQLQRAQLSAGFVFPPNLQDLTIPLCSLNRPVFEAVCDAYGCTARSDGCGSGDPKAPPVTSRSGQLRGGCEYDTGSTAGNAAWQRHLAGTQPVVSRCAATHGCGLGCGSEPHAPSLGSGGSGGAAAACSSIVGATRDGGGGGSLRSLHIPTLAGYSHWEGSFLASARDFQQLSRLSELQVLHLSLDVGAFRTSRAGLRACFQNLLALRNLTDLRVAEAQQPVCFSIRKRSSRHFTHHHTGGPSGRGFGAPGAPELSGRALQQLQGQWPRLRTLQFFSETIVRSGGRLAVPNGLDEVELLPPSCACCAAPALMAVPRHSIGRWDRMNPRYLED